MLDPRNAKLAKNLINQSVRLQKGENVLIETFGHHLELTNALVNEAHAAGGNAFVRLRENSTRRVLLIGASEEQIRTEAEADAALMRKMQCYIGIRGGDNSNELSDVPADKMELYTNLYSRPVHNAIRIPKTRWVVLRYPSPSMAQQANMSTEAFEDYYYNVCNLDYAKMGRAMEALKRRMEAADKVHILGPGTDLTFSIKGLPAIPCAGEMNIPDGEIFTAPVKESIEGKITYNTPSLYRGKVFENISFTFKNGKIVDSNCNLPEQLEKILDTDEGARYVGEFAFGVNPHINTPMKDTLFDEKIAGSIHFTPGNAYDECDNGNRSAIHWDLVLIQSPAYGGGEIWFDDTLIRKDGRFVPADLDCLNPENLL